MTRVRKKNNEIKIMFRSQNAATIKSDKLAKLIRMHQLEKEYRTKNKCSVVWYWETFP